MIIKNLAICIVLQFSNQTFANDTLKIHSIHKESFSCTEHWDGQFKYVGDALGTDCVIGGWYEDEKRLFQRTYSDKGFRNEDWFGFKKEVLAPCDCTVSKTHINSVTNEPGVMTPGRASSITFRTRDGNFILLAHVRGIMVKEGDAVERGDPVAKVGNNGYSRNPHIHVGAWNAEGLPMQLQFDQSSLALSDREKGL